MAQFVEILPCGWRGLFILYNQHAMAADDQAMSEAGRNHEIGLF